MTDDALSSITKTVSDLADQIEGGIEAIKARGASAFASGDTAEISYQLERLTWSLQAVKALREVACQVPSLAQPRQAVQPELQTTVALKAQPEVARPVLQIAPLEPAPLPPLVEVPDKIRVLDPEPEPEDLELKASLLERQKGWLKETQDVMNLESWSNAQEALAKALVAEGRGMLEAGYKLKGLNRKTDQQLEFLKDEFDRKAAVTTFFGFNPKLHHLPYQWYDLGQAYRWLADAIDAINWLDKQPEPAQNDQVEIVLTCAAAEANLYRKLDLIGKGGVDEQQKWFHSELETMAGETLYVPYWNRVTETDASVEAKARTVTTLTKDIEDRLAEAARRQVLAQQKAEQAVLQDKTLSELEQLLEDPSATPDFEGTLVELVDSLMELGVPPTNRRFDCLLPFRGPLELSQSKKTKRLLEHLNMQYARLKLKAGQFAEAEPETELADGSLTRVQAALKGKRVLFLGGNKGQGWRQKEYKDKLGIEELVWPNFEEHTKTSSMASYVDNSDVVCYLIRWSRHSYKDLLDLAKEKGKECLTLSRGVGINTFVKSYDEQILQGQARAS
jgi:hypothetical protein